jgi:hypothetical protein
VPVEHDRLAGADHHRPIPPTPRQNPGAVRTTPAPVRQHGTTPFAACSSRGSPAQRRSSTTSRTASSSLMISTACWRERVDIWLTNGHPLRAPRCRNGASASEVRAIRV